MTSVQHQAAPVAPTDTGSSTMVGGGIPVAHLPAVKRAYLGSPSIVVRGDGCYVVAHDVFGEDSSSSDSYLYLSEDGGGSWHQIAHVPDAFWSSLFMHQGSMYLLGATELYGNLVIRRSDDGGLTWTVPSDGESGILRSDAGFHTAPVPLIEHDGRLWRTYEINTALDQGWGHFSAGVMSIPISSDLLVADNWSLTVPIEVSDELRANGCPTWLEGNIVEDQHGKLVNILRAHVVDRERQFAVRLQVDSAHGALRLPAEDALLPMPGGGSKFTIRFDPQSRCYFSLVNTAMYDASPHRGLLARNTLTLARSRDLESWDVLSVVAHHPDDEFHGFQYADWVIDGDDIVAAVRTASEFDGAGAHSYHDSNLITFHRISRFREC